MLEKELFGAVIIERSACLRYCLNHEEYNNNGWVGGNAPAWFDDKEEMVHDDNELYAFYMTFR